MDWRILCAIALSLAGLSPATAADAAANEVARIHVEAIGGAARVAALRSLRARGDLVEDGMAVPLTVFSARPNRVRMELRYPDHVIVSATDGRDPPWEFDSSKLPAQITRLTGLAARDFLAESDFDDPLVAGETGDYHLQSAGEQDFEGGRMIRFLVTRGVSDTFNLLVSPDTSFIVARLEQRATGAGRMKTILTHYKDFRPLAGVLIAHEINIYIGGKLTQQVKLREIVPNLILPAALFSEPRSPDTVGGN